MSRSAVFLDRDGTINEEVRYLCRVRNLRLVPGAAEAVRRLNEVGFPVIVVSNQAGVARGHLDEEEVARIHSALRERMGSVGARLDDIYYCPHHPTAGSTPYRLRCECRKPRPGMLRRAAEAWGIDLEASFMVGDKLSDIQAGQAVGCRTVLVRTGYGARLENAALRARQPPAHVADDVLAAAHWIVQNGGPP